MSSWKGKSSLLPPSHRPPPPLKKSSRNSFVAEEELGGTTTEDDDLDNIELHVDSMNAHLLFAKDSSSSYSSVKEPLFPQNPRKNFFMMSCKRTLFGCRGLLLFLVLVFLVMSFVSSLNGDGGESDSEKKVDDDTSNKFQKQLSISLPYFEEEMKNGGSNATADSLTVIYNMNCSYRWTDYAMIGNSILKGIQFYENNVENLTVIDAALGTKIATVQIRAIEELHPGLPVEIKKYLNNLSRKSELLTERIVMNVKRTTNDTEDLKYTLPWLDTKDLWHLPLNAKWQALGSLSSYNPPEGESFEDLWEISSRREMIDEKTSDACIYQVFNCHTNNITENCEEAFLTNLGSMYSLTHQVIYMLLGQKLKCFEEEAWKNVTVLKENGKDYLEKMCGKVWNEANSIAEANFPPKFRDLLTEQIGMCSLSGYTEFLRRDWLRRLVSWQAATTSGCFGERRRRIPPPSPTIGDLLRNYQRRQSENQQLQLIQQYLKHEKQDWVGTTGKRRDKRSDIYLEDNGQRCSVHFTSVAITALSVHLRYFFDTCLDAY